MGNCIAWLDLQAIYVLDRRDSSIISAYGGVNPRGSGGPLLNRSGGLSGCISIIAVLIISAFPMRLLPAGEIIAAGDEASA
ncbi:MAG: hypothetical protein WA609_17065, partial [Terriglobales bacterium]